MVDGKEIDPVWCKTQGNFEFNKGQFQNAHAHYVKCIKANPEFLMARLNRATCFLKMRDYSCCLQDLADIQSQIDELPEENRSLDPEFYDRMLSRVYLKRGAAYAWTS
jgi:tetratricopeptide (TPR) repeat protein